MVAAVTDAYATPTDYRNVVSKTDNGDDANITSDLIAVSRFLDTKLGRFFTRDAAPVARVFTVPGSLRGYQSLPLGWAERENPYKGTGFARHLTVDDMAAAPTSVIVDSNYDGVFNEASLNVTALGGPGMFQDFELWPPNAPLGPEPAPWTMIVLPFRTSQLGFLGGQRIQVTAPWGWPAVPMAVNRAVCQLTGILRLESPRATSRINEMQQVVSTSKVAQDIVYDLICRYTTKSSLI